MNHKNQYYKQGVYKPKNTEKYSGNTPVVYRSSWELKFMRWCDLNEKVKKWSIESVIIPYLNPLENRVCRYYVDGMIMYEHKTGDIKKYLVEIKPYRQTIPPKPSARKKPKTLLYEQQQYIKNTAKWTYAKEWCKKNGFDFLILTEKELLV